ncbi:tellurite resistance TerB C-terminal domain-containing protein [Altericista sp. CCNU0014]|uniref:tellurite resistance TerB C-terminal domain-containing protein n=1 Tax=Altericista sp. CCNU0014 TaxID=3082949 RepID=UPI00384DB8EA
MLRDLLIGGVFGVGLCWWRTQSQRVEHTLEQSQSTTQQLQQQLAKARQELAMALAQHTALETQVAELNQLATDRAINLIQLQADNADLMAQVAELSQKRTRKKRAVKGAEPFNETTAASQSSTAPSIHAEPEPEPELPAPAPFALNLERIQAKQLESAEAMQLLQSVFVEEPISVPSTSPSLGLDSAHATFLHTLKQQTVWSREDLVRVARQLDLLLDGALELINEAAFDRCDEALTEGEDPLEVNPTVLQELLS